MEKVKWQQASETIPTDRGAASTNAVRPLAVTGCPARGTPTTGTRRAPRFCAAGGLCGSQMGVGAGPIPEKACDLEVWGKDRAAYVNVTVVRAVDDRDSWTAVRVARRGSGGCAFSYPWPERGLSWPLGACACRSVGGRSISETVNSSLFKKFSKLHRFILWPKSMSDKGFITFTG